MIARPILFSGPMIRALLAGRKTQTRRIVKQPNAVALIGTARLLTSCPYGQIGDLLWARETWADIADYEGTDPGTAGLQARGFYRADHPAGIWSERDPTKSIRWRPSINMPRRTSRLTLKITDVRVQRLQEISEEDAKAEGSQEPSLVPIIGACWSDRDAYAKLWEAINGKGSWAANPWVWVLTFEVIQRNVDAVLADAKAAA